MMVVGSVTNEFEVELLACNQEDNEGFNFGLEDLLLLEFNLTWSRFTSYL